ncbi:MAG: S41 family peptidase [Lentimicrobiaceae bacterium]
MKNLIAVLFLLFFSSNLVLAADEGRLMTYPDIYKDKIVFTYENDLWLVSSGGGTATRLTSFPGNEFSARFSPDGKSIAFTAGYDGTYGVYVMSSEGGEPGRLTYTPGSAQSIAWTPDGKRIVFRSYFENYISRDPNLYFVNKEGSAPERFPIDRGVLCSFNPDGSKMLYCRKGSEEYYWKRYKGGQYQDIWMYDFKQNQFTPVSDYVGKNSYPIWIGNTMYFVSDRTNGIANLYAEDLSSKTIKKLTDYADFDIMWAENDGEQIVFIQNGYINIYDTKTNQAKKISVTIPTDKWRMRDRVINPKEYVHAFNISNDGQTAMLESRGDIFTIPTDKGNTKNISNTPGSREMYPQISPDGKWIAFFSDKTGEYQLYMQNADGGEWIQLTSGLDKFIYHLLWSPDGKKILFGNKEFAIFYVDIDSKKLVEIDRSNQLKNDEFYWEESDYSWSPDSKWITYSFTNFNRNNVIYIYSLEQKKKFALTNDFFDNLYPSFDANGKYLYYVSSRNFNLHMDFYEDNHVISTPQQVMVVQLRDHETPPFEDPLTKDEKKSDNLFKIDIDGIATRTYPLPIDPGNYFFLKAGNGKVTWCSVDNFTEDEYEQIFKPGSETKWKLNIFDMSSKSLVVLNDKIRNFDLSTDRNQLIIQKETDFFTSSVADAFKSKAAGTKLNLDGMSYTVNNLAEWTQIFNDTWRWYRDFFYDKNFHGHDWKALGEKFKAYLPYLSSREELNWLLSQMVGEISVSHTYIGGGDMGPVKMPDIKVYTGWLGADFIPDKTSGYYKFDKIYGPTEYNLDLKSPLVRPDIDLHEGDYLIAINGNEIKAPEDYFKYLQVIAGQTVTVTINSKPTKAGANTYEIKPIGNSSQLRYFRWITDNINYIQKKTDGKVGYMHINAMGSGGIGEFDKYWRAFRYKEGLIIDVRRNSGGWTEYFLIDKLERKMTAYNVLQGMVPFRYPGSTSTGPYVAISNEYNGSDGEAFIEDFKANKLGTVVGVPSWGGLVGIVNAQTTIDNGSVNQSNNSFYGKEGKWLVENHGADPDILVDNDPASVMAGKDNQLDKAIEVVLQKIKEHPFTFPPVPAYPVK